MTILFWGGYLFASGLRGSAINDNILRMTNPEFIDGNYSPPADEGRDVEAIITLAEDMEARRAQIAGRMPELPRPKYAVRQPIQLEDVGPEQLLATAKGLLKDIEKIDRSELAAEWRLGALCGWLLNRKHIDTDPYFFNEHKPVVEAAKKVCELCVVSNACLKDTLDGEKRRRHTELGVWGGTSERERHKFTHLVIKRAGEERPPAVNT